tara:strand:- start:689 stop:934 length:246 start_codon:yes stop_codon:yes gene_type:complete
MSKKDKWEIEYEKKKALNKKGLSGLSIEQKDLIDKTIQENFEIINHVAECFDIELDQLRKLQDNTWKLVQSFNYQDRKKIH